ncbi:hypothetical protein ACFL9U_14005 [Thermodesulfobacteriota bacterium]
MASASWDDTVVGTNGVLTVNINSGVTDAEAVETAIEATGFNALFTTNTVPDTGATGKISTPSANTGSSGTDGAAATGNVNLSGDDNALSLTANAIGDEFNIADIVFTDTVSTVGNETATYNTTSKILTVGIKSGVSTLNQVFRHNRE